MMISSYAKRISINSVLIIVTIVADEKIQSYIKSKKLGAAIREIDESDNRKKALEQALTNKEFREFADHCLRTLELLDEDDQFTYENK